MNRAQVMCTCQIVSLSHVLALLIRCAQVFAVTKSMYGPFRYLPDGGGEADVG